MSSELRLKKLRGSGGYIMANVTDEQQSKGNLGGPDLFLAPIGRIDSQRISKHFCNTCEREFEGAPEIEYENPNEEVAENLVLVERGKYVCATCSSTLAEYREFQKPNETIDVGNAKPMDTLYDQVSEPSTVESYETSSVEASTTPDLDFQSFAESSLQSEPEISQQPTNSSVNSIEGMTVYDENAKKIGVAKQVGVDSSQSVVLIITKNDGSEIMIPWSNIGKIGEVILLGTTQSSQSSPQQASQSFTCSGCGFDNKEGSKFCENCGTKI